MASWPLSRPLCSPSASPVALPWMDDSNAQLSFVQATLPSTLAWQPQRFHTPQMAKLASAFSKSYLTHPTEAFLVLTPVWMGLRPHVSFHLHSHLKPTLSWRICYIPSSLQHWYGGNCLMPVEWTHRDEWKVQILPPPPPNQPSKQPPQQKTNENPKPKNQRKVFAAF